MEAGGLLGIQDQPELLKGGKVWCVLIQGKETPNHKQTNTKMVM